MSPHKRLLIRPGAIGDFIASIPALQFLKTSYTEIWCAQQNVPLARFADRAISIGSSGLDRIAVLPSEDVLQRLRAFDDIYSWYGTAHPEFRDAVSTLPFRFFDALPPPGTALHATEFFCAQVGAAVGAASVTPVIDPGPRRQEDFIILHPFASSPSKRWPLEHFRKLAAVLDRTCWCAGPEEPLADAVRIRDLYELAQWISTARAYVGNDSGITHLAAAVGIPVVVLFGPTDSSIWAPRGKNVRVISRTPIHQISPQEVFAALASLV